MADPIIGKISVGDGATFTPAVSSTGVLSWSNNKALANPADFDIPGKVLERGVYVLGLAPIASPAFTGTPTAPTPGPNDNSTKLATTAYVQGAKAEANAYTDEAKAEANAYTDEQIRQHGNVPVGFEYFSMNPNVPQGSLPLLGGEYNRSTYSDLWEWVQQQTGYLKTEAEWQALSASNNGNVPYYSSGDGSTTFRVPSLKCWVRGANGNVSEVGSYLAAGLPNIEGAFANRSISTETGYFILSASGSFAREKRDSVANYVQISSATANAKTDRVIFDASQSSPIYGNANTVQPESIVGLWLVKAYGTIVDTGQIDEQQYIDDRYAAMKTYVDGKFESVVAKGTNYIRYESGLQICWGFGSTSGANGLSVTFPVPFSSTPSIQVTLGNPASNTSAYGIRTSGVSNTGFTVTVANGSAYTSTTIRWFAVHTWKSFE